MEIICQDCGGRINLADRVGFREICPTCSAYLHSCVHCRFYVQERCAEPQADEVRDPRAGNYCEWYRAKDPSTSSGEDVKEGRTEAEALWRKLTGKD